jgi:hypothetical protein
MIDCPQRGRAAQGGARGWLALLATRGGKPHLTLAEARTGTLPPEWPALRLSRASADAANRPPFDLKEKSADMLLRARASRPCPRWTTWAPRHPARGRSPQPLAVCH